MAPLPLTCGGVECAGVEPGQPERLLGRVEAGARNLGHRGKHQTFLFIMLKCSHHDLGDPSLPGPLDHSVQVTTELLVGQVGSNVNDDVVAELIHHGRGFGDLSKGDKIR